MIKHVALDLQIWNTISIDSPLYRAVKGNHLDLVEFLIQRGLDVNSRAMHIACMWSLQIVLSLFHCPEIQLMRILLILNFHRFSHIDQDESDVRSI